MMTAATAPRAEGTRPGRNASDPRHFRWRDWRDIGWRVVADVGGDHLSVIAAGIAFFAMLALFPSMAALISLYGFFANTADVAAHLSYLQPFLPPAAYDIVALQMEALVTSSSSSLQIASIIALGIAFWSTRAAVAAMIDGLNFVYGERETRGFLRLVLLSLALTLLMLVIASLAILAIVAVPTVLRFVDLGPLGGWIAAVIPWPILTGAVVAGLSLIYRYGPDRATARKRWVTPGAVTATVLWMVASLAFSVYVASFADYNKTYGSLGAIVILLLWFYLGAFAILLGAEVNAEMELHTRRDTTTGPERPIGSRGAYVADNVAWDRRRPVPAASAPASESTGAPPEQPAAARDRDA